MNLSGSPFDFILAFFGGILISFTPCIYPLLPITVAYIGANSVESRLKGFALSLIYVTGISVTYALMGLLAVLTGTIFGQISSLPLVRMFAGLIIILFGFAFWFGWSYKLPFLKSAKIRKSGNYFSCFIFGLSSGLVIGPCTAPALGSILTFVATTRNFVYGIFILVSFAYGMGLLLIIAGTFSSILVTIPKTGRWLQVIKRIAAVILIAAGIYIVSSALAGSVFAQEAQVEASLYDFTLKDLDGKEVRLAEFKGKQPVVLFFWTTWCPYCLRELRYLNSIYQNFISDDIVVLSINVQESKAKVKKFISKNPTLLKVLLDSDGVVGYSYRLIGVPTFILINKKGEIVFKDHYFPIETYQRLLSDQ